MLAVRDAVRDCVTVELFDCVALRVAVSDPVRLGVEVKLDVFDPDDDFVAACDLLDVWESVILDVADSLGVCDTDEDCE